MTNLTVRVCVLGLLPCVVGCTIIPASGPTGASVQNEAVAQVDSGTALGYSVVKVTPEVLTVARSSRLRPIFSHSATNRRFSDVRLGVGDSLTVTVFEAGSGGLFIPAQAGSRPGNFVTLPVQQVDRSGLISIPYAGQIRAVGRTTKDVEREIEGLLRNRAIEPQVVVNVNDRKSNDISVVGEVNQPTRFSMDPGGIQLLGAIARAGGAKYPGFETLLNIQRAGRVETVYLSTVAKDPLQNISLSPGDVVYVEREPKVFLAFGATPPPGSVGGQNNRRFLFESDDLSLAEAVAKAGGLDSIRADPRSVFLFRMETPEVLARLGLKVVGGARAPIIYRLDLGQPDGYFLASEFPMNNKDLIYVSDSPSVDFMKFMDIVRSVTSTAQSGGSAANEYRILTR